LLPIKPGLNWESAELATLYPKGISFIEALEMLQFSFKTTRYLIQFKTGFMGAIGGELSSKPCMQCIFDDGASCVFECFSGVLGTR
jgi:hypothetical protein